MVIFGLIWWVQQNFLLHVADPSGNGHRRRFRMQSHPFQPKGEKRLVDEHEGQPRHGPCRRQMPDMMSGSPPSRRQELCSSSRRHRMSPRWAFFRPSTLQVCESAGPRFFGCRDDGLVVHTLRARRELRVLRVDAPQVAECFGATAADESLRRDN